VLNPDFEGNPDPSTYQRQPSSRDPVQRTISGHAAINGTTYAETYTFPHDSWIVTVTQKQTIETGFRLANRGERLLPGNQQAQFLLTDELTKLTDSDPPERAYLAGSLTSATVGGATYPTVETYPIFYVRFLTKPRFFPIAATDPTTGEALWRMICTLEEADIYYAAEQLPSPTITATQVAPLAADSPIGLHFATFS
jgi:hypothetical protein